MFYDDIADIKTGCTRCSVLLIYPSRHSFRFSKEAVNLRQIRF